MEAIDLSPVSKTVDWAATEVAVLHGIDVDDTDAVQHKRRYAADVSRDLLHLADALDLAAAQVRQQYWLVKGYLP